MCEFVARRRRSGHFKAQQKPSQVLQKRGLQSLKSPLLSFDLACHSNSDVGNKFLEIDFNFRQNVH